MTDLLRRKERATRVLTYYLKTAWVKAGARWDYENVAEVADLVDDLMGDLP